MSPNRTPESELVHTNPWFAVRHSPDPDTPGAAGWFRVDRPDSAMLIPELPDGRIVLIHGTRDTTGPQPKYELPAGAVEPAETPEHAALRELTEETGYVAAEIVHVGTFTESPGISGSRCSSYVGLDLVQREQSLDPAENWVPVALTLDEVDNLSLAGEIVDGSTLAALYLYRLYRSEP